MQNQFKNLKVWQKGMELVKQVYAITRQFPKDEQFGLTSQMRRAAVSVPANIAEGKGRYHKKEYIQFLYMARGSIYEIMTLIEMAQGLRYFPEIESKKLLELSSEITAMLNGLIQAIQ
ncbi:MAG: four helix bundle protein [Candidatus Omnitrophica bacterium CG12_big_fil_rev_8_21_14_0_65_42_8]|nr:MAG: four helix bundle protein [Candidatus Omnitrophica bacterium CG12_big_fil_rev_8_21_14_0_65_42_8]